MTTKTDFRDHVHRRIAGATPDEILAAIRADYCQPPNEPGASVQTDGTTQPHHDNQTVTQVKP